MRSGVQCRPMRAALLLATLLVVGTMLLAACGSTASATHLSTPALPTDTATPLPSPTTPPVTPTATAGLTSTTCLPDAYGLYSSQTTYITSIDAFNLPAPPKTKHGIGSTGTNSYGTLGGASGLCTIGTQASIDAFYDAQLPSLGWSHSTPPSAVTQKCSASGAPWSGVQWWKDNGLFSWGGDGDAGGGSVFWSYNFCMAS
jgi:hypothetical protein